MRGPASRCPKIELPKAREATMRGIMQQSLVIKQQDDHRHSLSPKKDQELRRAFSEMVLRNSGGGGGGSSNTPDIERAECECCGMWEDCTPTYIAGVKGLFCGRWVCGICAEAVKEDVKQRAPAAAMEEALQSHMALCKSFKSTQLNPQLSLASAMRDIARKSLEHRTVDDFFAGKVPRTNSCHLRTTAAAPPGVKFRRASFQ